MDGTTADLIVIPIVAALSLAVGLFMVMWAGEHPGKSAPRRSAKTAKPVETVETAESAEPATDTAGRAAVTHQAEPRPAATTGSHR